MKIMDRFINYHDYDVEKYVKKFPSICVYNCFKSKFIAKVKPHQTYDRSEFLVDTYPVPGFLKYLEIFHNAEGRMELMPSFIVDNIKEAICSINIHPSPIRLSVQDKNYYVLFVRYTNEDLVGDKESQTKVELEYTFSTAILCKQFYGYFSKDNFYQEIMPIYEVIGDESSSTGGSILKVTFDTDTATTLTVKIDHGGEIDISKILRQSEGLNFPDELKRVAPSLSLLEAVLYRVFPTRAHFTKCLIDDTVQKAEQKFRQGMAFTPLEWDKSPEESSRVFFANYMKLCFADRKTKPISHRMKDEDMAGFVKDGMKVLIEKYPFFTVNACWTVLDPWRVYLDGKIPLTTTYAQLDQLQECVYDIWQRYFNASIPSQLAQQKSIPFESAINMVEYYFRDPVKYWKVINTFPYVKIVASYVDLKKREEILDKRRSVEGTVHNQLTSLDVVFFNRIKTPLPRRWRFYLLKASHGKDNCRQYELGEEILKKKAKRIAPQNVIEEINYIDVDCEQPLTEVQLMKKLTLDGIEELDPRILEARFQGYKFSDNYRISPTEDDCLAVRFANVYRKNLSPNEQVSKYTTPEIPEDFYDRLISREDEECGSESQSQSCAICLVRRKNTMFPTCWHICVCELCSLQVLSCPICNKPGNPCRVYF